MEVKICKKCEHTINKEIAVCVRIKNLSGEEVLEYYCPNHQPNYNAVIKRDDYELHLDYFGVGFPINQQVKAVLITDKHKNFEDIIKLLKIKL